MISIIICSRTHELKNGLKENIKATIGCEFEIVFIDNSMNNLSIYEAYNFGVEKSKGNTLCFLHDDILFNSMNWGVTVQNLLKSNDVGAIGIAGTPYFPKSMGTWWGGKLVYQVLVANDHNEKKTQIVGFELENAKNKEVIAIDGVWMCIRKDAFLQIKFDNETFDGFHFYDLDISLQIKKLGLKIFVSPEILIEHHSYGDVNKSWIKNAYRFQKKWKKYLPMESEKLGLKEKVNAENRTIAELINILKHNGLKNRVVYIIALQQLLRLPIHYFIFYTPFKLLKYMLLLVKNNVFKKNI